jgi:biopolymer transport protein ExbD
LISQPQKKQVSVFRDGTITLDGKELSLEDLTRSLTAIRSQYPGLGVELSGDGRASWEMVTPALQAIHLAGVDRLRINVNVSVMNR